MFSKSLLVLALVLCACYLGTVNGQLDAVGGAVGSTLGSAAGGALDSGIVSGTSQSAQKHVGQLLSVAKNPGAVLHNSQGLI